MSAAGIFSVVFGADEAENHKPVRKVVVDIPGGDCTSFFIPIGSNSLAGSTLSWGPHYVWADLVAGASVSLPWKSTPMRCCRQDSA